MQPKHTATRDLARAEGTLHFGVRFVSERRAVIRLRGDVDMCNAGELDATLEGVDAVGVTEVVIDAAAIEFVGAAFLSVAETWAHRFESVGGWLRITRPSRTMRRLFDLTDTAARFGANAPDAPPRR